MSIGAHARSRQQATASQVVVPQSGSRTGTKAKEKANGRVQVLHTTSANLSNGWRYRSNPSSGQRQIGEARKVWDSATCPFHAGFCGSRTNQICARYPVLDLFRPYNTPYSSLRQSSHTDGHYRSTLRRPHTTPMARDPCRCLGLSSLESSSSGLSTAIWNPAGLRERARPIRNGSERHWGGDAVSFDRDNGSELDRGYGERHERRPAPHLQAALRLRRGGGSPAPRP